METECYPCIPMHSASNQKRMNHSTITMIKTEPLSEDVNVDVDDESTNSPIMKNQQNSILQQQKSQQFQQQTKQQNTRKTTRNQIVQQNNQNQLLQQQQQNQQNQFKAAEASRVQQHTIRLSRVSKIFFGI